EQSYFTRSFAVALFPIGLVAIFGLFRHIPVRLVRRRFAIGSRPGFVFDLAGTILVFSVFGLPGPIFLIPVFFLCLIVLPPLRFFFFGITGFGLLAQPLLSAIMIFRVLPVSLRLSLLFLPLRLFLLTFCLFLLLLY